MKSIMKYTVAAALMLAMAACQSEEDFTSAYESDPDAVKINATIAGMTPLTRVNTGGNGDTWVNNDMIKVTNTTTTAIVGKKTGIYQYATEGNKWAPQETNGYMVWADGSNTFEAFYPYDEDKSSNSFSAFELPSSQVSGDISKADWMTATASVTKPDNKSLNLTFKHELVKVTMKIVGFNNQYISAPPMQNPNIYIPTTCTSIEGKTVTIEANRDKISATRSTDADSQTTFIGIIPPGKFEAGKTVLEFSILYNSKVETLSVTAPAGSVFTTGLEAGKAYTFELTVGKNAVTIGNVTVNEWGEGGELGSGTAEEVTESN